MNASDVGDQRLSNVVKNAVRKWTEAVNSDIIDREFDAYQKYLFRKCIFIFSCIAIIVVAAGIAITIGSYDIGFFESYQILWDHITGNISDTTKDYIIVELRTPRVVIAIIAGVGLAIAGTVMQSVLLNPLADSYTTGISSGASLGATLALTAGASATLISGQYSIVISAFVFSLIPMFIIITVSRIKKVSPTVMIMSGIAVMYLFNACTTLMMLYADPNDMQAVYEWQVGSVSNASWAEIPIMLVVVCIGSLSMQLLSIKLNVLATGDDNANSMGINVERIRILSLLVVSLMSAVIVSFTGLIGFVGLVSPHIARLFIGSSNKYLIPASAVLGAMLLVVADLIGRALFAPVVLQVGVVMAFMGGPMFLWLLVRKNSRVWS